MACHLSRFWMLLFLTLVALPAISMSVALGQSGSNSSVAFVSDGPLTAQGPMTGGQSLRYSGGGYGMAGPTGGGSHIAVVGGLPSQPQQAFAAPPMGGGRIPSAANSTAVAGDQEDRGFKFPSLKFLGGGDKDDQDPPPQSSIAVVGGGNQQNSVAVTAGNMRMVDPNVAPASYRQAARGQQVQTRERRSSGGSIFDLFSRDDDRKNTEPATRQPGNNMSHRHVPNMQPQPNQGRMMVQQQSSNQQQPHYRPPHQLSPNQRQRVAGNMPRPSGVSTLQPSPQSSMANNQVIPTAPTVPNATPAASTAQSNTPRPSPSLARRESTPAVANLAPRPTSRQTSLEPRGQTGSASRTMPSAPQAENQPQAQPEALTPAEMHARELIVHIHQQSQTAETEEDFTLVVETCRRALAVQPTGETAEYAKKLCAWALNRRGQFRADVGDNDAAMLDFEDAVRCDPEQWRAVHNRGVLFAQQGKFEQAFDDFNLCTELNPRFAKAYSNRAALFVQAGDLLAALQDYRRAITLDPDLAVAHKGRGRVCHMLGSTDEALQHFDAAAQLAPGDAHVVTSRGDLLADLGRYADAAEEYRRAIAMDDELVHAYRSAAWLLATCPDEGVRNAEMALEFAERAIDLDSQDNAVSLDTLAAAQANAGYFEAASETIHRAIEIAPREERPVYEARLKLYQRAQPFRVKPAAAVATVSYDE